MLPKLLRPLLIIEFLIAIQVVFTFWSQVGGQYHLDLMYWPWKFGVSVAAGLMITGITAALVRSEGAVTRRIFVLGSLLLATIAIAGYVTYYYHLNEPDDEDDSSEDQPSISWSIGISPCPRSAEQKLGGRDEALPHYQTRQELARTIG
jgi:hypothetical protein